MALGSGVRRLFRLVGWRSVERDVDDELAFHIEARTAELVARGAAPAAAREAALREFGDVAAARAELGAMDRARHRGARRAEWWEATWQDLRYAARGLGRQPGFTAVVVLTLALGIGANAAMFGLVDHLHFRTPPGIQNAGELRRLWVRETWSNASDYRNAFAWAEYQDVRAAGRGAYTAAVYAGQQDLALGPEAGGAEARARFADGAFFPLLGVRPALGRFFTEDEGRPGAGARVAVLDHGFWLRRFGGAGDVLGREITLGKDRYTVIGVTPEKFSGVDYDATDVWLPIGFYQGGSWDGGPWYTTRAIRPVRVLVRVLGGGDERVTAMANAALLAGAATSDRDLTDRDARLTLAPLLRGRGPEPTQEMSISTRLGGVSVVVLLVACANVANLLLARAMRRRREIAVRLALGVNRGRLVRQLLTEGVLLAVLGGGAALLVAAWGGQAMRTLLFPNVRWVTPTVDARALWFTAAVALLTGVLASLAPALQASRPDVTTALRDGWRRPHARRSLTRSGLLVAQTALSVVLIAAAALFVRSLHQVRAQDFGIDVEHLVAIDVRERGDERPAAVIAAAAQQLADRVRTVPGVERATLASIAPFMGWSVRALTIPGRDSLPPMVNEPVFRAVAPDYLTTVGTTIVRGRGLTESDRAGAPLVTVINERMAQALWPGEDPLGTCLKIAIPGSKVPRGSEPCTRIVGIARNSHHRLLVEKPQMQLFVPLAQASEDAAASAVVVRTRGDAAVVAAAIRAELRRAPGSDARVMAVFEERLAQFLRPWQLGATLFSTFGLLALIVAAVGCYSVLAFAVSQRTHEMGIRVALGARTTDVLRLVVGEGVRVTALGVVLGLAAALATGRLVAALLFGTSPRDPAVLAGASLLLLVVAAAASFIPAWRAARVDPTVALRAD